MPCAKNRGIISLHQGDIGHAKLLTIDINTDDHPPITQKLYTLCLIYTQEV